MLEIKQHASMEWLNDYSVGVLPRPYTTLWDQEGFSGGTVGYRFYTSKQALPVTVSIVEEARRSSVSIGTLGGSYVSSFGIPKPDDDSTSSDIFVRRFTTHFTADVLAPSDADAVEDENVNFLGDEELELYIGRLEEEIGMSRDEFLDLVAEDSEPDTFAAMALKAVLLY